MSTIKRCIYIIMNVLLLMLLMSRLRKLTSTWDKRALDNINDGRNGGVSQLRKMNWDRIKRF